MSVISNRESTDYIPFGGTASSMSSSARYSAVQTRTARRKVADRMKRLDELRLKQLKAKCALEISNLELDIMESTIHSEESDKEIHRFGCHIVLYYKHVYNCTIR